MTSPTTAGTGCSPHTLQDRRPAYPAAYPLVTLIVILPAARPRYAQAARAQSPVLSRPRAGAGGAGPHRRPGSAGDYRPATADAGALAPEASLLATARHPVLRASTPTVLHGSAAGATAPTLTASSRGAAARGLARALSGPQVVAAGIPALPACRPWHRRSCRAESGKAPPCMRCRGLTRPRRARPAGGTPIPRPGQRTPLYAAADLTPRRGMPPSRWSPGRPTRLGGPAAQQPFTDQPRLPGKRLVPARVRRRPVVAAALVLLAVVVAAWFAVRPGSGARHPQEGTPAGAGCGRAAWPSRR